MVCSRDLGKQFPFLGAVTGFGILGYWHNGWCCLCGLSGYKGDVISIDANASRKPEE